MKAFTITMTVVILCAFSFKAGVITTSKRVDHVLNHQANAKLKDSTFWAMTQEFPEDVN